MAQFLVYVTEKRKRRTLVQLTADRLDVGTRSTCALTLQDPVAAERHCEVSHDAASGTFVIKDLGTTTGTYVNGLPAGADGTPLTNGDVVVVGASRLAVSIDSDDQSERGTEELQLELFEKAFQFQKAEFVRQTGDWIQGDRERWVESEVTFSRFPLLRKVAWGAGLLALLGPLALLSRGMRADMFEPGPLSVRHAAVLAGTSPFSAEHEAVAAQGCQACHEPMAGVPLGNCYACHDAVRYSHPFQHTGDFEGAENSCLDCHVEHGGAGFEEHLAELSGTWAGRTAATTVRTGDFVPQADAQLCERCHPGLEFEPDRRERLLASFEAPPPATRNVKIAYDGFSHSSHVAAELDCKTCHVPHGPSSESETTDRPGRDFAPMQFEGCMGCHGPESMPAELRSAPLESANAVAATSRFDAPLFPVSWHGATDASSRCEVCHTEAYAGEMRTVSRELFAYADAEGAPLERAPDDPRLLFRYQIRHHTREFEEAMASLTLTERGSDADCARCHVDGDWVSAGEAREGRFYHALHLTEALRAEDVAELRAEEAGYEHLAALSQACDECHAMVRSADTLASPFYRSEEESCAGCHGSGGGADDSAIPRLIDEPARMRPAGSEERIAFPHAPHTGSQHPTLAAGCYACHVFAPSGVAFRDPVMTPAAVRDCTQCHDADHASLGSGSCGGCHAPGDPVYTTPLADAAWPITKEVPLQGAFDHFSPGHLAAVETDCTRCHDGLEAAENIRQVRLPAESSEACRSCHIEELGRYHWR